MSGSIQQLAETKEYRLYGRDNCLAMVHFTQSGDSSIGSSGLMTDHGIAYLMWRDGRPLLVSKGIEVPAMEEQVAILREFSADLKALLTAL